MGISGLLPVLKSCSRPVHVREYRGCKVVVDGYSWLHKGAYTCARELCEGIYTDRFVQFCLSRVELLRQNGVLVTVVLDGGRLPMKAKEEDTRKKSRRENLEKARTHLLAGNVSAAQDCYQKAVGISSNMAKQLIEALKDIGVPFIVAPYEADAQMCYMSLIGEAHTVITEDSDLLAYGCERVLYKLDRSGHGEEICLADLPRNKGLSFVGFSHNMFLEMCIMAGCDFLPNLPGIGIKKAHGHLKKLRSFLKVVKSLRFSGVPVPRDYEVRFQMVLWVFRHQRVYCPKRRECVHVRPLPPGGLGAADVDVPAAVPRRKQGDAAGKTRLDGSSSADVCTTAGSSDDLADQGQPQQENGKKGGGAADPEQEEDLLSFLGPMMPPDVAKGVAQGDLQPSSKQPYDLAQIYQGCPTHRMPAGVQRLLFPKPTTDSTTHAARHQPQQQHHQWPAHTHRPQKQALQQQGKLHQAPSSAIQGREGGNKQIGTGVASKSAQGLGKQGGTGVGKAAGRLPQLLVAMTQHQVQHQQHLLQQQQAERLRQSSARAITAPFVRPSRSRPAETSGGGAPGGASRGAVRAASKGGVSSGAAGAADAGKAAASGQSRNSGTSSSGCSPSKSKPQAAQQAGEIPFRVLVATSSVKAAAAAKHSATNRVSYASRSAGVHAGAQERGSAAAATAAGASSGTATRSAGVQGGARVSGLSKTKLGQGRQQQQQHQQQQKQQQLLPLRVLSRPRARKEAAAAAAPAPHGAGKTVRSHQSAGGPPPKRQRTEPSPLRRLLQQHQQEPQLAAAQQHASPDAWPPLPHSLEGQQQQQQQQQQHTSPAAQHQLQQERQHQLGPLKTHNSGEPTGLGRQNIKAPASAFVAATSTSTDESAQGPDSDTAAAAATAAATAAALNPPTVPAPHTPHCSPLSHFPSISDGDLDNSQLQAMLHDSQEQVISETTEEADLEAPAPLCLAQQPLPHHSAHHHHHHKHQQHQEHHNQHKTQAENHVVCHLSHDHHHNKQQGAKAGSRTTLRAPLRDISNTAWGEQGACADERPVPATAAGVSTAAATAHGAGQQQQQQQQGRSRPMSALSALGFRPSGVSSSQMEGMGGLQLSQQTSSMDLCGFAAHAAAAPPTMHQRPSVTSVHCQHKPSLHPIYQHHDSSHYHHHHHRRHRHHSFHQQQQCPQEFPKQDDDEGGSEPEVILPEDAVEDPLPVGVSEGGLAGGDDDSSPGVSGQLSDSSVESWEGVGRGTAARMRALLRGRHLEEMELEAGGVTSEEGEGPSQQQQQQQQQSRQLFSSFPMDGAATANVSKDQQDDGSMPSSKRRRTHSTRSVPVAQQLFGLIATNGRPIELQQQQQQQQGRQLFDSFAMQQTPQNCQHPNKFQQQQQQQQQVHFGQDSQGGQAANNNSDEDMADGAGHERGPEHAAKGNGSSGSFHSVGYMKQYGEVAARAIDHVMGEAGAGAEGAREEENAQGRVGHGGAETGTGEEPGVPLAVADDNPEGSDHEGVVGQLPCAFEDGRSAQFCKHAAADAMLHQRVGPLEGNSTPSGLAPASESEGEFVQGLQDACPDEQLLSDCVLPPQPCLFSSAPASLAQQALHASYPLKHQHQHSKAQRRTPPSQGCTIDALMQRHVHCSQQQHHSSKQPQQHRQPPVHVPHNPFSGLMHTPTPLPHHQHTGSKLLPPAAPGSKSARKPSTAVARVLDTKKGGGAKTKAKGTSGFALCEKREEGPSVFVAHSYQKPGSKEGKVGLLGGLG